jgi:uncharacterized membrane protein
MNRFGDAIIIVDAVFWFLATLFVVLRLASRTFIVRKVNASDWATLVGWLLVTVLSGINIFAVTKGLGLREGVLPAWRRPLAVAEYVFAVLYVCLSVRPLRSKEVCLLTHTSTLLSSIRHSRASNRQFSCFT